MAEKKAQRGAEVVELFSGDALHLGIAFGIEPGVFAVEQKDLAGGICVVPAHAAGFEKQEGAAFCARSSEARVGFSELGFEGMKLVVVAVDTLGDVVRGRLLGWSGQREKDGY
jgi:hypothetical protein